MPVGAAARSKRLRNQALFGSKYHALELRDLWRGTGGT